MDRGQLEEAVLVFEQSVAYSPHFKTLELLGECMARLGRHRESIVPLAAATTLNKGSRAPSLLAEAFLLVGELDEADELASIALTRDPKNRKALEVKTAVAERRAIE